MPVDHRVHRIAQPVLIEGTGHGDIQLHRIHIVAGALRDAGVKEQPLLQGGQRQHVSDAVLPLQLVDLLLAQPGRRDIRRRQPAPTAAHMRADTGQGVKPQPAKPGDLRAIQCRGRPRPVGVQVRAGVGVDGAGVEVHGVHQWHGHRRGSAGQRHAFLAETPHITGRVGRRGTQTPQIVKPDRRVGPGQVHLGVQIAQHTIGQRIREGAKLLFGVFDQRPQCGLAGQHLRPGQPTHRQRHRVFGGKPPHGARQVNIGGQLLVAPMALHIDTDRRAAVAQKLLHRQPEGNQQDVMHPGVKRRRHLTEQHAGGLDIQRHRQVPGAHIRIHRRLHRRQRGRGRRHLPPRLRLAHDLRVVRMLGQQRRPPGKRRPGRRQHHLPPTAMLSPGDVEIL